MTIFTLKIYLTILSKETLNSFIKSAPTRGFLIQSVLYDKIFCYKENFSMPFFNYYSLIILANVWEKKFTVHLIDWLLFHISLFVVGLVYNLVKRRRSKNKELELDSIGEENSEEGEEPGHDSDDEDTHSRPLTSDQRSSSVQFVSRNSTGVA